MDFRRDCYVILCLLFALLVPAAVLAQSTQGTILGIVKDPSGAVIPAANITLTATDTGVTRKTVTGQSGQYQFFTLTEGHYSIAVSARGFENEVLSGLTLAARQQLRADVTLRLGNVNQKVTVNAQSTGATTDSQGNTVGIAPIGRFGNAQVGSLEGPGTVNWSAGLFKTFTIYRDVKLRAEGTFANVLNHTNLNDPNLDISSPQYETITTARGSDFGSARNGQVSLRLEF